MQIDPNPLVIDLAPGGPYANYNWELLYHIPVMVAVHLSNNQRFAEAQKWFHLVFDPTSTDTSVPTPQRFWKFLVFRGAEPGAEHPDPAGAARARRTLSSARPTSRPSRPCSPATTRCCRIPSIRMSSPAPGPAPIQWYVVMKYLDNLIAWGDSLFLQDTIET